MQEITEEKRIYLANSMNSLRIEGQKTVAIEIVQQFDWEVPDWIVIPGGNLGNVHALGQGFVMMQELGLIQQAAAHLPGPGRAGQPALPGRSRTTSRHFEPITAQPTLAMAIQIGNPVSVKRAIRTLQKFNGVVEQATEQELADEAARADRTGMFNCPHTGVALAALLKLVERKVIRSQRAGGRHLDRQRPQVRRPEGRVPHGRDRGDQGHARNMPVELPADPERVARAIARHVERARLLVSVTRAPRQAAASRRAPSPTIVRRRASAPGPARSSVHGGEPRPKPGTRSPRRSSRPRPTPSRTPRS